MKKYIYLSSPNLINSSLIKKQIENHIKNGLKTYQIKLIMQFTTSTEIEQKIVNTFRVLKNKASFALNSSLNN